MTTGRYASIVASAPPPNFANRTMWTRDNLDVLRGLNSESLLGVGQLGAGAEHLSQSVRQPLVNGTRQTGAVERCRRRDRSARRARGDPRTASKREAPCPPTSDPETASGERPGNSSTAVSGSAAASWKRSSAGGSSTGTARPDTARQQPPDSRICRFGLRDLSRRPNAAHLDRPSVGSPSSFVDEHQAGLATAGLRLAGGRVPEAPQRPRAQRRPRSHRRCRRTRSRSN